MLVEVDIEIDDLCESYANSVDLPLIQTDRLKIFRGAQALVNILTEEEMLDFINHLRIDNNINIEFK